MSGDVVALLLLLVLLALAVLAPRFGADSRSSRAWSDEDPRPYPGAHP
jgi:hypothetical protein